MREYDRTLFASPLVQVGAFRCGTDHRDFNDTGPSQSYCFVFPRSAVWIHHDGSAPFVADPNVIPFYNAGKPYRRARISSEGDRTDWLAISSELLREAVAVHDSHLSETHNLFKFSFSYATPHQYLAQRRIFNHILTGAPDQLYVEEAVIALLDDVLERAYSCNARFNSSRRHQELAQRAKEQLNRHLCSGICLGALAASLETSIFHLCRVFKHETGATIHQYRLVLKLHRSLELLEQEDTDILDVGLRVGFSSHSHFTRTFRRVFGVTPSQFRGQRWARFTECGKMAHSMSI